MKLKRIINKHSMGLVLLTLLGLMMFLTACNTTTAVPTRDVSINEVEVAVAPPTPEPYVFKTSDPNTITVHGKLIVLDPMTIIPAPDDSIFLVPLPVDEPISMIPQFELGTVPQADVDESSGEFVFTNLEPGQYAVVVITMGRAQIPTRFIDTSNYAIFTVDETQLDTTVEIGKLTLP